MQRLHNLAGAALLLACAGCAAAPVSQNNPKPAWRGVILVIRPLRQQPADPGIVAGLAASGRPPDPGAAEFILRDSDGRLLSIVQPDSGFRPGQSVFIQPGRQASFLATS